MSLENQTEEIFIATEKKDENESQKSMSDGEIVDDDDVEDVKPSSNNVPLRKLQKNFRARHSDSDDDEDEEEGAIVERKTDKKTEESKKLNARIVNGDEKYLQSVRKKIINELNEKDETRREERHFNDRRRGNFHQNRFNNRQNNRFRPPNDSFRRNTFNSRNPTHDRRENGKREVPSDMLEIRGRYRLLHFPKNIIKHTKTTPSISYAENPQSHHHHHHPRKEEKKEKKSKRHEEEKKKEKSSKEKRRSRSRKRSEEKVKNDSPKEKIEKPAVVEKTPPPISTQKDETMSEKSSSENVKLTEENTEERTPELPIDTDDVKEEFDNVVDVEEEESQQEEKMKFEPIIIERKTIRKVERPKVNIFLEDSDEVDEFENANVLTTLEVKSKWSSPEPEKPVENDFEEDNDSNMIEIVPKSIESRIKEKNTEIPEVFESPEKSPVTPMSENIFESSSNSMSVSKSPTPMSSGKPVKNVCSFLSDIESEGYLSGFSLGSGLYSDDDEDDSKLTDQVTFLNTGSLFSKNPEPDTTFDKLDEKEKKESNDDDSDSDESESSSSSESSSDSSSSSESEDESSDSSDDETTAIVSRYGGFGRFDATSIPMVTQIKPVVTQTIAGSTAEPTVAQSRFQPHQSIIRPPQLVTNLTRPALYPTIATPATPMPFATPFGTGQFPVPFKIYSLKDAGNTGIIFPSTPVTPIAPQASTPLPAEKEKEKAKESDREKEKRPEKRERERHRSRSHSRDRDRDRKRHKDDRRDSDRRKTPPPKRRSLSPKRRTPSPAKRKHNDVKRRDSSPRHSNSSHNSRSRHSPVRRSRRSRSRSPARTSINSRPRTPPSRPRTPPPKMRRISPRRSHSRSPPSKYRRSTSPNHRNHHHSRSSPSPIYRRSPRRRYSPSPIKDQNHLRRTPSRTPDYDRYDRRSYSPSYRGKLDSPNGYKQPDSTISDTELERQQQFAAQNENFYSWNSAMPPHSPRRQNLDERIHRMLSDSPTSASAQQQMYPPDGTFPYPQIHDNHLPPQTHSNYHQGLYYPDIYSQNQSSFMPPPSSLHIPSIDSRYSSHNSFDDGFNAFPSPRYINNSNLVEITQQKRERQRLGSNQVAVQVGNCLEIVPNSKIPTPPQESSTKSKSLSPEEIRQQSERREQAKLRRKADRERKRMAKFVRKEKLRQEIQKYFDAGINIEDSDDENLIKLRPVNVNAVAERGIIKKSSEKEAPVAGDKKEKRVLFTDGVHAGETSSDEENNADSENTKKLRIKRKRIRKKRLNLLVKERKNVSAGSELEILAQKQEIIETAPPDPPPFSPPPHLKQPQLKVITADMFAAFAVNHEPMYYHLHKLQAQQESAAAANAYHHHNMPSRNSNDRYRYNKHQQPPPPSSASASIQQQSQYMQQQRYCIPPKPLNSLDPRINQQRSIEKSFA